MPTKLPLSALLPNIPNQFSVSGEAVVLDVAYAQQLHQALRAMYMATAARVEELIESGTYAEMPDATGAGRLYYATDTQALFIDHDGVWIDVGGDENIDGGRADSVYTAEQLVDGGTA
jgi:hypothetical protein